MGQHKHCDRRHDPDGDERWSRPPHPCGDHRNHRHEQRDQPGDEGRRAEGELVAPPWGDVAIPEDIPLTSFSTVLARYKGDFESYLAGTPHLSKLNNGDKILILESCTHHVSCDDIGRIKIPRWLSSFSGKQLEYEVVAGLSKVPGTISDYSMVIQCGGCMITRKQLINRLKPAIDAGIPVTNYGMAIAYMHGIYERAVAPFVKLDPGTTSYL